MEDPEIIDSQFLRINVRHVTDGAGVVVGSILITPKVLMFNPNLSDQLVEESEPEFKAWNPDWDVVGERVDRKFAGIIPSLEARKADEREYSQADLRWFRVVTLVDRQIALEAEV